MRLARSTLTEDGPVFRCTLSVAAEDVVELLAMLPAPGKVFAVLGAVDNGRRAVAEIPTPPVEAPPAEPLPKSDPNGPPTQRVMVDGLQVGKLGMATRMTPTLQQLIYLVRDPQFQAWCIEQEGQGMPADAVEFAGAYVCKVLGTDNPMELPESEYHRIDALISSYTAPKAPPPAASAPVDPPPASG